MNNIIVHMNMIIVKTVKEDTFQHTSSGANSSAVQGKYTIWIYL